MAKGLSTLSASNFSRSKFKKTSQSKKRPKLSSMNKSNKRGWKKYRGQG